MSESPFSVLFYSDLNIDVEISDDAKEQSEVNELLAEPGAELKYILCLSHLTQHT